MATTVIIPARNEETTIGPIVKTFSEHPETQGRVFVGLDPATTDETGHRVVENGGSPIRTYVHGKGQVVYQSLLTLYSLPGMLTDRIILCDGDYSGLTTAHIDQILGTRIRTGMVIGVPDWPEQNVPAHVTNSWPHVSGFRVLPWAIVPEEAHGYLLETQLNKRAIALRLPIKHIPMDGLKAPFEWPLPTHRLMALKADARWGKDHGVL